MSFQYDCVTPYFINETIVSFITRSLSKKINTRFISRNGDVQQPLNRTGLFSLVLREKLDL